MTKLRKFTFPILIGILLVILAACGGDDESETTSPSTGGGASPTAAPTAVPPPAASSGMTELVSEGLSFKFQYACINRTLDPCVRLAAPGGMVE